MNRILRLSFVSGGITLFILAAAFLLEFSLITQFWPWAISRLSAIFIASILAAIAAPILWIGISQEKAAITGGAINLALMSLGMGIFSLQLYFAEPNRQAILIFGLVSFGFFLFCLALFAMTYRADFLDKRPTPTFVTYSFLAFAGLLILTGGALLLKIPNIFPWPLGDELSVLYGWIFIGASCYFLYGFYRPYWGNAQGQLLGFLAYDLVLILPFLQHFATVANEMRLSLIIYVAVLIYSGLLAIYYLFLNKQTAFGLKKVDSV